MTHPDSPAQPTKVTPLVRQFNAIKAQYPQHVLMIRMGDFYETFGEDAKIASRVLGITLTKRPWGEGGDMALAGVPYHTIESYLAKFVRAGVKVAICDQMEDPRKAKGLVKREVTRIVTPGTILESNLLDDKAHNFLVAACERVGAGGRGAKAGVAAASSTPGAGGTDRTNRTDRTDGQEGSAAAETGGTPSAGPGGSQESHRSHLSHASYSSSPAAPSSTWGLAVADLSTGAFEITEFSGPHAARQLFSEIGRLQPAEVLLPDSTRRRERDLADASVHYSTTWLPDTDYEAVQARRKLLEQFQVQSLEGYGAEGLLAAVGAAGALVQYLRDTQFGALGHINHLAVYHPSDFLVLDLTTQRSLELVQALHGAAGRVGTLIGVLDQTQTPMGGRMLRAWLLQPLKDAPAINQRLDAVEEIHGDSTLRGRLAERLRNVHDLERIISRVGLSAASPRDLAALRQSLGEVPALREALAAARCETLHDLREELDPHESLCGLLQRALSDQPPFAVRDGGVIREGYSAPLDEMRTLARDTSEWMDRMRQEEVARTGISTLKIKYNKVFGFFIEVSKAAAASVPADYIRKQTLVGAERYITPALKEKEEIILHAQERIEELEADLFESLRQETAAHTRSIQRLADALGRLDCLAGLAAAAIAGNYVRPEVDDGDTIEIRDGRHPVVEALQGDRPFVPNDAYLSNSRDQILLITGPNMAGKSTFIRQVALLTLMAQMGSFVPASSARVGVVDRIFTRVGAMDSLVRGQSTFLVEMSETANILNNATDRSLVILDEIGRGTSTYDGLSIAWSVVEYLHATPGRQPKTLFATHYHELTELEETLSGVRNYNVAVLEQAGEITFLFKIVAGSTDHSYGIYAGKVAGLPRDVIERAQAILHQLEFGRTPQGKTPPPDRKVRVRAEDNMVQLSLFDGLTHPVLERLRALDANSLTPMQALQLLGEMVAQAK